MKDFKFIFEKWVLGKHPAPPVHEPEVQRVFKRFRGDTFIDIGSNTGIYTRLAKGKFRRIISIDPNPKYHALFQMAISDHNGFQDFHIGEGNGSYDSLIVNPYVRGAEHQNSGPGHNVFKVACMTYDELKIEADLVKIDVEEGEFLVMEGMKQHLPKALIIELHDERRENQLLDKMKAKGYSSSQIDETHWVFKMQGSF